MLTFLVVFVVVVLTKEIVVFAIIPSNTCMFTLFFLFWRFTFDCCCCCVFFVHDSLACLFCIRFAFYVHSLYVSRFRNVFVHIFKWIARLMHKWSCSEYFCKFLLLLTINCEDAQNIKNYLWISKLSIYINMNTHMYLLYMKCY